MQAATHGALLFAQRTYYTTLQQQKCLTQFDVVVKISVKVAGKSMHCDWLFGGKPETNIPSVVNWYTYTHKQKKLMDVCSKTRWYFTHTHNNDPQSDLVKVSRPPKYYTFCGWNLLQLGCKKVKQTFGWAISYMFLMYTTDGMSNWWRG